MGRVADLAGNTADGDSVDAGDGIPPGLSVTVEGVTAQGTITDDTITITVASDEALTGAPTVWVQLIEDGDTLSGAELVRGVALTATRTWEAEVDIAASGIYNVFVSGEDLGARLTTKHSFNLTLASQEPGITGSGSVVTFAIGAGGYPPQITISAGTTVTWTNDSDFPQNLESCSGRISCQFNDQWASGDLQPGESYSRTFNEVGTFYYRVNSSSSRSSFVFVEP